MSNITPLVSAKYDSTTLKVQLDNGVSEQFSIDPVYVKQIESADAASIGRVVDLMQDMRAAKTDKLLQKIGLLAYKELFWVGSILQREGHWSGSEQQTTKADLQSELWIQVAERSEANQWAWEFLNPGEYGDSQVLLKRRAMQLMNRRKGLGTPEPFPKWQTPMSQSQLNQMQTLMLELDRESTRQSALSRLDVLPLLPGLQSGLKGYTNAVMQLCFQLIPDGRLQAKSIDTNAQRPCDGDYPQTNTVDQLIQLRRDANVGNVTSFRATLEQLLSSMDLLENPSDNDLLQFVSLLLARIGFSEANFSFDSFDGEHDQVQAASLVKPNESINGGQSIVSVDIGRIGNLQDYLSSYLDELGVLPPNPEACPSKLLIGLHRPYDAALGQMVSTHDLHINELLYLPTNDTPAFYGYDGVILACVIDGVECFSYLHQDRETKTWFLIDDRVQGSKPQPLDAKAASKRIVSDGVLMVCSRATNRELRIL